MDEWGRCGEDFSRRAQPLHLARRLPVPHLWLLHSHQLLILQCGEELLDVYGLRLEPGLMNTTANSSLVSSSK